MSEPRSKGLPQTVIKGLLESGITKLFGMGMTVSTHTKRKNALLNLQVTVIPSMPVANRLPGQKIIVRERREETDFANSKGMNASYKVIELNELLEPEIMESRTLIEQKE